MVAARLRGRPRRATRGGRRCVLAGAWLATHWLLRESAVWRDRNTDEVREAQRHAEYAYRLAVDPPAAKEVRLFGLVGLGDGALRRADGRGCTSSSTRRPACGRGRSSGACCSSPSPTSPSSGRSPPPPPAGGLDLGRVVVFAQVAVGTSAIAFGGLSWALDGAAAPVAAVLRLEPGDGAGGALAAPRLPPRRAGNRPAREIRFRDVTFAYPGERAARARGLRPDDRRRLLAGDRRAERRGQDDARQAALPALRPAERRHRGGRRGPARPRRRGLAVADHRRLPGLHPLRAAPARQRRPRRAPPTTPCSRRSPRPAPPGSPSLDTPLARGYEGGTDLSGGQWQRVALARALCAVRLGAGLVLLDEPTAQLDVRGEAEIFDRILTATRKVTTILISHRFSTVRHADRICVLEHGRVVELGTHDGAHGAGRPLPHDVRAPGEALRGGDGRGGGGL